MDSHTRAALVTLARDMAKSLQTFADELDYLPADASQQLEPLEVAHAPGAPRQQELLDLLVHVDSGGEKTRKLADKTGVDQPNVYLTLQTLARKGLVERVPGSSPQRWRLAERYLVFGKLRAIADRLPHGYWTTDADVSIALYGNSSGTAMIRHVLLTRHQSVRNFHRIRRDSAAATSALNAAHDQMLRDEGVEFDDEDQPTRARRLAFDHLTDAFDEPGDADEPPAA